MLLEEFRDALAVLPPDAPVEVWDPSGAHVPVQAVDYAGGVIRVSVGPRAATRSYLEYLDSPEWRALRRAAMRRANWRCEREQPGDPRHEGPLEVSHRHFRTLGCERLEDLEVICPACRRAEKLAARRAREKSRQAAIRAAKRAGPDAIRERLKQCF